jgi:diguanylate cyclase (GGDEF)-like protein
MDGDAIRWAAQRGVDATQAKSLSPSAQLAERIALGKALSLRESDIVIHCQTMCLGQLEGLSFEDVAAVPLWDLVSLAVQAIVDWLSTGETVRNSVRSRIDSLGSVAGKQLTSTSVDRGSAGSSDSGDAAPTKDVVEQLSVALFTKLNFWWSDKTCAVLAEEAVRLGTSRATLQDATSNVVKNCKVSLVRMAKQYDAEMAGLHGELRHQALHDALTGLPNRALILDRIGQMLARGRRQYSPVAVLFLDLDNFKDINDTLGHRAGDELLVAVGARLASAIREADTAGRLGGDEFVVLTEGASLAAGAGVVAERILDVMATPFEISGGGPPLQVNASIGYAEGDRATPEELLQDADIALYQAKAAGKRRAVKFAPSMQEEVDDHRNLEVDLDRALEAEQFFLVYQPTVDLQSGAFNGVEALLRWRHPHRGIVQPDDFIPALESSGLIIPVGAWVLHDACRQGAAWIRQGYRFTVSVNVSGRQLEEDRLINDVQEALLMSGFDPGMLILELTETELGVRIAIDDFGTGYSSLGYLRQFPIDVLKIDRSFVSGIGDSAESAALVHTLVQLGKVLGIETVAEGVETTDQRTRLEEEQVDIGQGFLFARPLEVKDVDRLLKDSAGMPEVPLVS